MSTTKSIIINNSIINKLLSNYKNHNIDGKTYYYLGKGIEGIVYKVDDEVIKIYTKVDMNMIVKEFYVFGLLQELNSINKNVVHIDKYYLSLSNPVLIMELMDGELTNWCTMMVENITEEVRMMSDIDFDKQWLGMIFQVTYGLMFLNRLGILHADAKAKNILFKKIYPTNQYDQYIISDTTYEIPIDYRFKIADFGTVQILGSSSNIISDDKIREKIKNRDDLYELSRIFYRMIVNLCIK